MKNNSNSLMSAESSGDFNKIAESSLDSTPRQIAQPLSLSLSLSLVARYF